MKPYYQDEWVTIYHGDCRDILPSLPKVDLVLTDPPYGINYNRNLKHRGSVNNPTVFDDDKDFDPRFLLQFPKLILWGANCYASCLPNSKTWLVWEKTKTDNERGQVGSVDFAWSNCIGKSRIFRHLWAGYYRDSESGEYYHPTQKPVALMEWCIGLIKNAHHIIDPYMGAGSTLLAAKKLNRKSIGIEIEERYCEIAAKRCSQTVMNLEI